MNADTFEKILSLGGNAGTLWVACVFLIRTLKTQYEHRIEALEKAVKACEEDRSDLHERFENVLAGKIPGKSSR
tara:strand:- start:135 stop:356 length:222 start_codon:yes stop_codon:yes gene_type:complete